MLLKYLPTRKFLSPDSFKTVKGGPKQRLWLHSNHVVKARIGESKYEGSSVVSYGIEVRGDHTRPAFDLRVDPSVPHCGVQSASGALDVLSEFGLKSLSVSTAEETLSFDMRSISYVCGSIAAMSASGIKPEMPDLTTSAVVMTPAHTLALGTSPTFTPSAWRTSSEFSTMMAICQLSGSDEVYLAAQSVPSKGKYLTGLNLGTYAARIHANIMAESNKITAGAAHHEAFLSGAISVMRVLGHSDEGGEIRKILRMRSYPRPVGLVPMHMVSVMELSTTTNMLGSDLTRYMVGEVLSCAGRISRSDLGRIEGISTTYLKTGDGNVASNLPGFEQDFYDVMSNWRNLCSRECGLVASDTYDTSSCKRYFSEDSPTTHYEGSTLVPFWYVEPGGVSSSMEGGVYSLGCQGQGRDIPLLEESDGYKSLAYSEYKGTPLSRSNVMFVTKDGYQARRNGINYLMSSAYRKDNGLSRFELVESPELGVMTSRLALCDNSQDDLASKRWVTPHCPTANPAESTSDRPVCLNYVYGSTGLQPTLSEFLTTQVESMFGSLYSAPPVSSTGSSCHRDVPPELAEFLAATSAFSYHISDSSGKIDFSTKVVSPSRGLPQGPKVVERADLPTCEDEVQTTPIVGGLTEEPESVEVAEQETPLGPAVPGVRPKMASKEGSDAGPGGQ